MANTVPASSLNVIKFLQSFAREYVRKNRLSPYSGKAVDSVICVKQDRGPTIRHPLVARLKGNGVSGSSTLRGNGENIGTYSWDTNPTYYRHAVEFDKENLEKTNVQLMQDARPLLMEWAMAATRDRQLQAFGAAYDGTTYANLEDSTTTINNAWQVTNTGRIIYGANIAHTGVHATELGGIDGTNDTLTADRVTDLRRKAEDADPHIHPLQTDQESEIFVLFCGSQSFRDLKSNLQTIHSNADVRGMKITKGGNILARDGDMFWDGVIIRKVPEITKLFSSTGKVLATAGAGSIAVEPAFLCGTQALAHGMGQLPQIHVDRDYDYNFQPGVAVELKEDVKKTFFNGYQHGVVTGFFSGAA